MLQVIKAFTLMGVEWVLYLLLVLSIWSSVVIWDHYFLFRKKAKESEMLIARVTPLLLNGNIKEVQGILVNLTSPAANVLRTGIENFAKGPAPLQEILGSQRVQEKMALEKNLLVLGTLGNNAPFIGLFGTVLGIIKAFNDLAVAGT